MYTHSLIYEDEDGASWASAEDSPDPEIGLLVWADQWADHPKGVQFVSSRFREWAPQHGLKFKIVEGRR